VIRQPTTLENTPELQSSNMIRGPPIKVSQITIANVSTPITAEGNKTAVPPRWISPAAARQEFDGSGLPSTSLQSIIDEVATAEIPPKLLRSSSGFPLRSGATVDRPLRSKTFHNDSYHHFQPRRLPLASLNLLASSQRAKCSGSQDRHHIGEDPTGRGDELPKAKTRYDAGYGISAFRRPSSASMGQEKPTQKLFVVPPQDQPRGSGGGDEHHADKQNFVPVEVAANTSPPRRPTISARAKRAGNSTQGLVPFLQWPAKPASIQEVFRTRSSPRISSLTLTNDQWKSNNAQNSIAGNAAGNAASNLCRIDEYICAGKYFEANQFPIAPSEYEKIEEKCQSDVLSLLQYEQAAVAEIDHDANQKAARGVLESKTLLFLSVKGFLECFVHGDKHDAKLVKKVWGITYCICALPLKEVSVCQSDACYSALLLIVYSAETFISLIQTRDGICTICR
jgi:hypothetical protein